MKNMLLGICLLLCSTLSFSTTIFDYIQQGNTKAIKYWLQSSEDLEVKNELGQTPLIQAVIYGNKSLIQKLLKFRVEVNVVDAANKTALDYAVESRSNKLVLILVKKGAKVTTEQNLEKVQDIIEKQVAFLKKWSIAFAVSLAFSALCVVPGLMVLLGGLASCDAVCFAGVAILSTLLVGVLVTSIFLPQVLGIFLGCLVLPPYSFLAVLVLGRYCQREYQRVLDILYYYRSSRNRFIKCVV